MLQDESRNTILMQLDHEYLLGDALYKIEVLVIPPQYVSLLVEMFGDHPEFAYLSGCVGRCFPFLYRDNTYLFLSGCAVTLSLQGPNH